MNIYPLNTGLTAMMHADFQAEDVSSLAWNTEHAEVPLMMRLAQTIVVPCRPPATILAGQG
jgi:hypothetical protein